MGKNKNCTSIKKREKVFTHSITLALQDSYQIPYNNEFPVQLEIFVNNSLVTITIPALNFTIPNGNITYPLPQIPEIPPAYPVVSPPGGFVYTVDGFLPKKICSTVASYLAFPLQSDVSVSGVTGYDLYLTLDGSLRIVGQGNNPIPAGPQVCHATSITYLRSSPKTICSLKNFPISSGQSHFFDAFPTVLLENQLGDAYISDIYNNHFVAMWSDNSHVMTPTFSADAVVRIGNIKKNKINLEELTDVIVAPDDQMQWQGSININPTNPQNVVFNSLRLVDIFYLGLPASEENQLWRAVSMDGGKTWPQTINAQSSIGRIDGVASIPYSEGDNNGLFDVYGNYWITNLTNDGVDTSILGLAILVSSDGGLNFTVAFNIPPDPSGSIHDFNQMAFGGDGTFNEDGTPNYALWFVNDHFIYIDGSFAGLANTIGYIPVTGLGQFGTAVTVDLFGGIGSITPFEYGSIEVSRDGNVFIHFVSVYAGGYYYNTHLLITIPQGIVGLSNNNIIGPYLIDINNSDGLALEASPGLGSAYAYNADNVRGDLTQPIKAIKYDNHRKVLYGLVPNFDPPFVGTNVPAFITDPPALVNGSQSMRLDLLISTNFGQTWSKVIILRDTKEGCVLKSGLALDPIKHNLLITWYDTRKDQPNNQLVEFYGELLDSDTLDKLISGLGPVLESITIPSSTNPSESNTLAELNKKIIRPELLAKFQKKADARKSRHRLRVNKEKIKENK